MSYISHRPVVACDLQAEEGDENSLAAASVTAFSVQRNITKTDLVPVRMSWDCASPTPGLKYFSSRTFESSGVVSLVFKHPANEPYGTETVAFVETGDRTESDGKNSPVFFAGSSFYPPGNASGIAGRVRNYP